MNRKVIFIGCGALAFVCLACIGFVVLLGGGVLFLTQPVVDAGNAYMEAIKAGDYATAYDLSASNVQSEMGSVEGLQTFFTSNNFFPESWSFNSRSIENNTGQLLGNASLRGGIEVSLELSFIKEGDAWKVRGISFSDR